jgi:salicylate hydroxylase
MHCFEVVDGVTMKVLHRADLISEAGGKQHNKFGAPFWTVHRVDLHNELLRLTSNLDIRLGAKVVVTDTEKGMIQLADGSTHFADLIVGADGLHSVLRGAVLGDEVAAKSTASGMSAFRFMLPTKELENDDKFKELRRIKGNGNSVLADTTCETERHMIWYTCRG